MLKKNEILVELKIGTRRLRNEKELAKMAVKDNEITIRGAPTLEQKRRAAAIVRNVQFEHSRGGSWSEIIERCVLRGF